MTGQLLLACTNRLEIVSPEELQQVVLNLVMLSRSSIHSVNVFRQDMQPYNCARPA